MNDTNETNAVETSTDLLIAPSFDPRPMVRHALFVAGDNLAKTTSRAVAEIFAKRHDNVMQAIERLDCSEGFRRLNFKVAEYFDAQGKPRDQYEMTFEGFTFLCMGFTGSKAGAFKEAYIAEFERMQGMLRGDGQQAQLAAVMQTMQTLAAEVVALRTELQGIVQHQQALLLDSQGELIDLLKKHQKPEKRRLKAMTHEAHELIVRLLGEGMPGAEIARLVECSQTTVSMIKHGRYDFGIHSGVKRREGDAQMSLMAETYE